MQCGRRREWGSGSEKGIYGNGLNGMIERGVRYTERMAGARIVQTDKRAWTDVGWALAGDEVKERDALQRAAPRTKSSRERLPRRRVERG